MKGQRQAMRPTLIAGIPVICYDHHTSKRSINIAFHQTLGDLVEIAYSIHGVPIRLTAERWDHIVSNKPYMYAFDDAIIKAIEDPTVVLRGYAGALIAILALSRDRYLHVVYKETSHDDGFVVTAYVSASYNRDAVIWPRRS